VKEALIVTSDVRDSSTSGTYEYVVRRTSYVV